MIFSKNNQRNQTESSAEKSRQRSDRVQRIVRGVGAFCVGIALNLFVSITSAAPVPTSVTLGWNPSPDITVTGYRVHYGVASGQYTNSIETGNTTSVTIPGLMPGVLYYFAVTAYNSSGVQSPFSNEISYQPSAPPAGAQLAILATPTGQMRLTLATESGRSYDIEATQDLNSWSVIGTVAPGASGSVDFTDVDAASFPQRFYRLRDTTP